MKKRSGILHVNALRIFLFVQAIIGIFSVYSFLKLPASEAESAIWLGLSLFRLATLAVYLLAILSLLSTLLFSFIRRVKFEEIFKNLRNAMQARELLLASLLTLSLVACIGFFSLEVLLNSSLFLRAKYYEFLYQRLRPISLWAAAFNGHLFLLLRNYLWRHVPTLKKDKRSFRRNRILLALVLLSWAGMSFLWVRAR